MKAWLLVLVCFFLAPWYAPAQTREETIGFIVSEYRSFESREYKYKEITFSPAGDTFTIRRAAQGDKDYVVTFNLKDVEVYKVTINHANGINQHELMVRKPGQRDQHRQGRLHLQGRGEDHPDHQQREQDPGPGARLHPA